MTPSAIRRIARATTSARTFHSGEPGEASGRQRLHARKPRCCAAAAVGEERHVLRLRCDRRARRPAVDAGGVHGRDEPPVEAGVSAQRRGSSGRDPDARSSGPTDRRRARDHGPVWPVPRDRRAEIGRRPSSVPCRDGGPRRRGRNREPMLSKWLERAVLQGGTLAIRQAARPIAASSMVVVAPGSERRRCGATLRAADVDADVEGLLGGRGR